MTKGKKILSAAPKDGGDSNAQEERGQGKGAKALKQSKSQPLPAYSILKFCVTSTGDATTIEQQHSTKSGSRGKPTTTTKAAKVTNTNSMPTESLACMLDWLETGTNKATVYGDQNTTTGAKLESKQDAFGRLAKELNTVCKLDPPISWDGARKRLDKYKEAYAHVVNWSRGTGAGVTEGGNAVNFDDELESRCFGFERMHALFKHCPKVKPAFEIKSNLGGVVCMSRKTNYSITKSAAVGDEDGREAAEKVVQIPDDEEGQDIVGNQESNNDPGSHDDNHEEEGEEEVVDGDTSIDEEQGERVDHRPHQMGPAFRNYRDSSPISTISSNIINSKSKRKHSNDRETTSSKGGSARTQSPKGMREDRLRAKIKPNDDIEKIMERAKEAKKDADEKLIQSQMEIEMKRQDHKNRRQEAMLEEAEKARVHEAAKSRADYVMKLMLSKDMSVEQAEEIVDRIMRNAATAASQTLGNSAN